MPKVSVIIPVYNAEKYIEKCARSLFEQTLDDIEYIFIDDCGRDQSIKILNGVLDDYPLRKTEVRILSNETNIGVGQSRQRGIDYATGDYLIHCDPDDWVDLDMYEIMYHTAIQGNSDVVICNYVREFDCGSEIIDQCYIKHKSEFLPQLIENKFHMSFCNKLIKRELAQKERIPIGVNLWEDLLAVFPILLQSNKLGYIPRSLYHYRRDNCNSIIHNPHVSNTFSKILAITQLGLVIHKYDLSGYISEYDLNILKLKAKNTLLYYPSFHTINQWRITFNEANIQIHDKRIEVKYRIYSCLALYRLDLILIIIITFNRLISYFKLKICRNTK